MRLVLSSGDEGNGFFLNEVDQAEMLLTPSKNF